MNPIKNIAIIGGGPAACTLAILLCRKGLNVAIYYLPEKAPILVGESLVPMIVPMLSDLGVEDEVAGYSIVKPGACFTFNVDRIFEFRFADNPSDTPSYSYNVPRKEFNSTLRNAAAKAGALLINRKVTLVGSMGRDKVDLDKTSIGAASECWNGADPDMIIDAAGRIGLISKLLNIATEKGPRRDVALFAHVDQTQLIDPGYVHNDRMEQGWCWRIPLPDKVSFGFVVPHRYADEAGTSAEEQYDKLMHEDPILTQIAPNAQRLTPVLRFDNYQSICQRLYGKNWALLGDSGGFVDPVFSSGLMVGMEGAYTLAAALLRDKTLDRYESETLNHLAAWHEIVGYYYSGRLMTSIQVGDAFALSLLGKLMVPLISKHLSRVFSGAAATRPFSRNLLRMLVKHGLRGHNPRIYAIE